MISKQDYDILVLEIKARLEKVRILKEESYGWDIKNKLDAEEKDLKDMLYETHYKYNSQFAKPILSKPYRSC